MWRMPGSAASVKERDYNYYCTQLVLQMHPHRTKIIGISALKTRPVTVGRFEVYLRDSIHCTLHTVLYIHCTLYIVHLTVSEVTQYSVLYTVYTSSLTWTLLLLPVPTAESSSSILPLTAASHPSADRTGEPVKLLVGSHAAVVRGATSSSQRPFWLAVRGVVSPSAVAVAWRWSRFPRRAPDRLDRFRGGGRAAG